MTEQKKKLEKLSGVKGMNDLLPQDAGLWEFFEATVKSMLRSYGYQNIRTPIVEHTQLFTRGIGEVTDIVEKEMYSFTDALNGEHTVDVEAHLGLRPVERKIDVLGDGDRPYDIRDWRVGAGDSGEKQRPPGPGVQSNVAEVVFIDKVEHDADFALVLQPDGCTRTEIRGSIALPEGQACEGGAGRRSIQRTRMQ